MYRIAVILCALCLAGCSPAGNAEPESTNAPAPVATAPTSTDTTPVQVVLKTTAGDITLELDRARAPITVANFLEYAAAGHYDNTIFHRVIPGFMIQGGGYDAALEEKETRDPIKNEAANGLKNVTGTVAMARTAEVDSATSQFFINVVDNSYLDHSPRGYGYAVFGKVVEGMDVVAAIEMSPTHTVGVFDDVPVTPIQILSVEQVTE